MGNDEGHLVATVAAVGEDALEKGNSRRAWRSRPGHDE
jgi:hypothetical protein